MDNQSSPGSLLRSKGQVRVDFPTADTDSVIAAGTFRQRNGTYLLLWQDEGGDLKVRVSPEPEFDDSDF